MILQYNGIKPDIASDARLIGMCTVTGNTVLKSGVSVWPGAVIRAELALITVGENSNIQDNATVHADEGFPVVIGKGVSVGHNAILHGCTVGDNSLIGMGAIVLNGAKIGKDCIIGAGAVVRQGMDIPDGSMVVGIPAVIKRPVHPEEIESNANNAKEYLHLAQGYDK